MLASYWLQHNWTAIICCIDSVTRPTHDATSWFTSFKSYFNLPYTRWFKWFTSWCKLWCYWLKINNFFGILRVHAATNGVVHAENTGIHTYIHILLYWHAYWQICTHTCTFSLIHIHTHSPLLTCICIHAHIIESQWKLLSFNYLTSKFNLVAIPYTRWKIDLNFDWHHDLHHRV